MNPHRTLAKVEADKQEKQLTPNVAYNKSKIGRNKQNSRHHDRAQKRWNDFQKEIRDDMARGKFASSLRISNRKEANILAKIARKNGWFAKIKRDSFNQIIVVVRWDFLSIKVWPTAKWLVPVATVIISILWFILKK